jgi:hypothetical protein
MSDLYRWKRQRRGGKVTAKQFADFTRASSNAKKQLSDVGDYKVDHELSNKWVQVYFNPQKKHCIIYHRGSADLDDAWTDVKLFFGQKNNQRFKTSQKVQKLAEEKYRKLGYQISTLGSSLGAYLATEYGGDSDEIITSGKPVTPGDVLKGRQRRENQYDVSVNTDPVALLQKIQKDTGREVKIKSTNPLNVLDNHLAERVMQKLPENFEIGNKDIGKDSEPISQETSVVGSGMTKKKLRSMKNAELKALIKQLAKEKNVKIRITGLKRNQLKLLVDQLSN